jgi:serine protease Do
MFGTPRFDTPEQQPSDLPAPGKTDADGAAPTVSSRRNHTAPAPAPSARRRTATLLVAFGLLASMATGFLGGYLGAASKNSSALGNPDVTHQKQLAASTGQLISSIAESVGPSVVSVNVVTQTNPTSDFFGFTVPGQTQAAAGTGIVISSEGVVVTNRHVVPTGVSDVSVTLSDGTKLTDVSVLGRTSDNDSLDVAFLKINDLKGHKLTPAVIGDSGKVQVGDTVVAIGNALGQFNNTVTSGIISGFGRSVVASDSGGSSANAESLDNLLQTDAAINQGNSGGPLVNTDGQVIGINTAVSGQGQNIGFAIPINDVNGLIKQVLSTGKFERPYLGVRYVGLTADIAKQYGLDVQRGAFVLPAVDPSQPSILPGSPADKAGLKEKDIIMAINGTKIDESHSLTSLIGQHAVGDTVKLTVLRDGKNQTLTAELAAMPNS